MATFDPFEDFGNADEIVGRLADADPAVRRLAVIDLAETALAFAIEVLSPGGTFIAKVLQGGATNELLAQLKTHFSSVKHVKPDASRKDSAEIYVVAQGFRK